MTDGKEPPPGLSIIEQMAAKHHESGHSILHWHQLSKADRQRKIEVMEAVVRTIPDRVLLKCGTAFNDVDLGKARDALIGDHDVSKASVLSRS